MQVPAGTVYQHLTVLRELDRVGTNRRFLCRCVCGNESVKFLNNLRAGRSISCGCKSTAGEAARLQIMRDRRERAEENDIGRRCHTCDRWLPWERFARDPRRARARTSNCMDCAHWRTVYSIYGITRQQWEALLDSQDGRCALCESESTTRLAIDHDHSCCEPGRACPNCIRGMLCATCNRLLGLIEQKPALANRFADYLVERPLLHLTAGGA